MKIKKFYLWIHNIRSLYNVGSIFRTADAVGIDKIYFSGYSGPPPQNEISKTAIGAEKTVPWEYCDDYLQGLKNLQLKNIEIVALELDKNSIPYNNYYPKTDLCLVLGHEITGVAPPILKLADSIIEIPMYGQKSSLNVSVAFGIAAYQIKTHFPS